MTLKEFNQLDEAEQIEVVWRASLMADFIEEPYRYVLYQINDFFIELRYHMESNVLTGISAFDDPEQLEPYHPQLESFKVNGKPRCTITQIRDQALKVLPKEIIVNIMSTPEDQLIILSYSLGVLIRNQLNMWNIIVTNNNGVEIRPDDATFTILKEIWLLDK